MEQAGDLAVSLSDERQGAEASVGETSTPKRAARKRADEIKAFRCKNLIVVIEDPIIRAISAPSFAT